MNEDEDAEHVACDCPRMLIVFHKEGFYEVRFINMTDLSNFIMPHTLREIADRWSRENEPSGQQKH